MKKKAPPSAAYRSSVRRFAPEKVRERKSDRGTIGARRRPSTKTNTANVRRPAVNSASTNGTGGVFDAPWVGVNTDRQTGRKTFDIRVSKEVRLAGNSRLQVLWEVFNLFNTANYSSFFDSAFDVTTSSYNPATNVATVNMTRDTGYLIPRADVTNFWGPRDMQLGIKFLW